MPSAQQGYLLGYDKSEGLACINEQEHDREVMSSAQEGYLGYYEPGGLARINEQELTRGVMPLVQEESPLGYDESERLTSINQQELDLEVMMPLVQQGSASGYIESEGLPCINGQGLDQGVMPLAQQGSAPGYDESEGLACINEQDLGPSDFQWPVIEDMPPQRCTSNAACNRVMVNGSPVWDGPRSNPIPVPSTQRHTTSSTLAFTATDNLTARTFAQESEACIDGTWFIWMSTERPSKYILSLNCNGAFTSYEIQQRGKFFSVMNGQEFPSISQLLEHYKWQKDNLPCYLGVNKGIFPLAPIVTVHRAVFPQRDSQAGEDLASRWENADCNVYEEIEVPFLGGARPSLPCYIVTPPTTQAGSMKGASWPVCDGHQPGFRSSRLVALAARSTIDVEVMPSSQQGSAVGYDNSYRLARMNEQDVASLKQQASSEEDIFHLSL